MAKKIVSVLILAILLFQYNPIFADDCSFIFTLNSKTVKVCDKGYKLDVAPLLIDSKIHLPFRFIAERLGAEVWWNPQKRAAYAQGPDFDIEVAIGEQGLAQITNKSKSVTTPMTASARIVGSRIMIASLEMGQTFDVPFKDEGKTAHGSVDSEKIKYLWFDFTLPVDRGEPGELINLKKVIDNPKTKAIIIEFWFTSCEHCKYQLEHMEKLYMKYKDDGLVVLSITTDGPGNEVSRWEVLNEAGITFPTLLDEKAEVYSKWIPADFPNFTLLAPGYKYALMRNEKLSDDENQKLEEMVDKLCGIN